MTALHTPPAELLSRRYAFARRRGVTGQEAYEAYDRWVAANPPLRHFLLEGAVACGRPLTAADAARSVRTLDAATCRHCHAAAAAQVAK